MLKHTITRVEYDPSNKEHRKAFFSYMQQGKWTKHFILKPNFASLPAQLIYATVAYYDSMEQEQHTN